MFRCVSRQSRPSSQVTRLKFYPIKYFSYIYKIFFQADSRPSSQQSRPGSSLAQKVPKKYAKHLEDLGSPDRDSPVLTPRYTYCTVVRCFLWREGIIKHLL